MFVNNLQEVKKYFREYRFVRNTLNNYLLYEKNHGLNEHDRSVLDKISDEFLQKSKEVNLFIESIADIYIKQLFCMRYLSGYTWKRISVLMGGVATADCYRNAVNRYFCKYFKNLNANKK